MFTYLRELKTGDFFVFELPGNVVFRYKRSGNRYTDTHYIEFIGVIENDELISRQEFKVTKETGEHVVKKVQFFLK